jgi:hypothetical protein
MKIQFALGFGLFITICPAMAVAEDFRVSRDALSAVGVSGMKVLSDEDGMQVRGRSSFVQATSLTTISGRIYNPSTNTFTEFAKSDFVTAKDDGWYGANAKAKTQIQITDPVTANLKGRAWGSAGRSYSKSFSW